jgi:quercetin dioxygenase-like cupin family protein
LIKRGGYDAKYVADIVFRGQKESAGFILVNIPSGNTTSPHAHGVLEEVFIFMDMVEMTIDGELHQMERGDVVLIEPGEAHWFKAPKDRDATLIAVKLPNLKDDKISS